ncbi:MAG: glycine oxidase ThiO [Acidobacteria bacterium]|nr:glycine oxidase ThiO [Acidobacteriota bacterium]MCB9397437.1 glycine oxidase ThiO [Acidobacteriota bacterium]
MDIAIIGAGLIGRWCAYLLDRAGHPVSVFEQGADPLDTSCSWVGAGMLAPLSELEWAEPLISQLGWHALSLYEKILPQLEQSVFFQRNDTLVVAHHQDRPDFEAFAQRINHKLDNQPDLGEKPVLLDRIRLQKMEPALANRFEQGWWIKGEGQVNGRALLSALMASTHRTTWHWHTPTTAFGPGWVETQSQKHRFDTVLDCRGLMARDDFKSLRGVRGELIHLRCPEVSLNRPVRMIHPRFPLYIVPRPENHFIIGATSIESEEMEPVHLRSAMELLSTAYSLHPAFAEATILEMRAQCRPAFPDNLPKIVQQPGLIRINGLYRHGFLIGPALAEIIVKLLGNASLDPRWSGLITTGAA